MGSPTSPIARHDDLAALARRIGLLEAEVAKLRDLAQPESKIRRIVDEQINALLRRLERARAALGR